MTTKLMEANPLVEEARGQVAVQRGPIVYCLESNDLNGLDIDNIAIPADAKFVPVEVNIAGSRMMALEGEVVNRAEKSWTGQLYREVGRQKNRVKVRLIPYYAWGNRGKSEMTIWMPWLKNILITIGKATKAIRRRSIVKASVSMEYHHSIARVIIC